MAKKLPAFLKKKFAKTKTGTGRKPKKGVVPPQLRGHLFKKGHKKK